MTDFSVIREICGYRFKNAALLRQAFTHTSYANEHSPRGHGDSNQRLEFLGDSVLSTVISTYLYGNYPEYPEGSLSRFRASVVCEESLCRVAVDFGFGELLLFGHGELLGGGREKPSVLADCVEAVIAAVYLDSDYVTCAGFVLNGLGFIERIKEAAPNFVRDDHKSALQEWFRSPDVNISYTITGRSGPEHSPVFEAAVNVYRNGILLYSEKGAGGSKKAAEQDGARKVLEKISGGRPRPSGI